MPGRFKSKKAIVVLAHAVLRHSVVVVCVAVAGVSRSAHGHSLTIPNELCATSNFSSTNSLYSFPLLVKSKVVTMRTDATSLFFCLIALVAMMTLVDAGRFGFGAVPASSSSLSYATGNSVRRLHDTLGIGNDPNQDIRTNRLLNMEGI